MKEHKYYQEAKTAILKAFASLRKQKYIARANFSCCGTCASSEIATAVGDLKENPLIKKEAT